MPNRPKTSQATSENSDDRPENSVPDGAEHLHMPHTESNKSAMQADDDSNDERWNLAPPEYVVPHRLYKIC